MAEDTHFTCLAVDDDPLFLRSLARILTSQPYTLVTAQDAETALQKMESEPIDLVILDIQMSGRDGISLLHDITSLYPDVPVFMLTGHGSIHQAVQAIKLGAVDFLEKPCEPACLLDRLSTHYTIWKQRRLSGSSDKNQFDYAELVGESACMQRLKTMILRIARSDAPVLIQGESGSGKELVARAVHHHSLRSSQFFCAVDCAAINESVIESELFGYEKGAFTGADKATLGLIRSAHRGTLFLDEIGEIPLRMQSKLLRTLQEQEVRPVGGIRSQTVDIRVIAATNRDLDQEIAKGQFRADLYFRIAALPIAVPSLRERGEDILLLANAILKKLNKKSEKRISDEAAKLLLSYSWPGNVRELENVMRRALALAEKKIIVPDDLPATLVVSSHRDLPSPENDSLAAYERLALENALKKSSNSKRKAAQLLGIGEATLYRKMKEYDLSKER